MYIFMNYTVLVMKILFTFVGIIFLSYSTANAALSGWEAEQTSDFIGTLFSFFSTQMLLKVIFAVIVVILTFVISKVVQSRLFWYLESSSLGAQEGKEELIWVISRTVNIVILITGFSITLGVLGIDLAIFMWGIWFGIGFTLRTFLTNFIAGIIVVTQWVYHSWDLIEVEGNMWKIQKINALFTAVEQFDGVVFYMPNIKFLEQEVRNYHTNDKRRITVETIVEHGSDIVKAKQILQKVIANFPNILQAPQYDVIIDSLWENGILIQTRFWMHSTDNYFTLKSNVTETINLWFSQAGIVIPYKQISIINK